MDVNIEGKEIVCWFSCGVASAVALKKTVELYGERNNVRAVYNPVKEEDSDNLRFMEEVSSWVGVDIELATNPKYASCSILDVFENKRYMSGVAGAPCTVELKKKARYEFEKHNTIDWHVLGFTADEQRRHDRFVKGERENVLPVLIYLELDKHTCMSVVMDAGIEVPRMYKLGYVNANCVGCVKATSPTYWNHVRKTHPEIFEERARQSRDIGARLVRVKGERIFLDELDPNAKGRPLGSYKIECGIFCSEDEG